MIWIENRELGKIILTLTLASFVYYTLWVIVLPFVDKEYLDSVSIYFPPLELALAIPAFIGSFVFIVLLLRAYHLVKLDREQEKMGVAVAVAASR